MGVVVNQRSKLWGLGAIGVAVFALAVTSSPKLAIAKKPRCAASMIAVNGQYCIDPYEESVEEKVGRRWVRHSPYEIVAGLQIRAVSRRNVFPQAHISRNEAEAACKQSGKILCPEAVWMQACQGTSGAVYPYGDTLKVGYCNDSGVSPLNHYYGTRNGPPTSAYGWGPMNDPRLNQLPGSLARTGAFRRCVTKSRVHDMVGNLHEWIDDPNGTFRGGYYLDTKIN